ncbi:hypothetical protein [Nocardia blacklockiae]|uniref:hypothetical protein n=1 Tax=Nocardia blacklockiae TaxID=480036 RepID=UPI00226BBEFC|nr:hypothetical protein [Nocardia blacklockiae]
MVASGPAGTLLSHFTGWRGGFWVVVALTLAGIVGRVLGVLAVATSCRPDTGPDLQRELATMRKSALRGVYAITILTTAAYMVTFNYLAAMLTSITSVPDVWIPAILALFGIGAFTGPSAAGFPTGARPHPSLLAGTVAIAILSVVLAVAMPLVWVVVPAIFLLGVAAFILNPALYGPGIHHRRPRPHPRRRHHCLGPPAGRQLHPALAAMTLTRGAALTSVCLIGAALATASSR